MRRIDNNNTNNNRSDSIRYSEEIPYFTLEKNDQSREESILKINEKSVSYLPLKDEKNANKYEEGYNNTDEIIRNLRRKLDESEKDRILLKENITKMSKELAEIRIMLKSSIKTRKLGDISREEALVAENRALKNQLLELKASSFVGKGSSYYGSVSSTRIDNFNRFLSSYRNLQLGSK